jgi:dipeptidyl aminopeptidase/acylaminoacyl peptidase
MLNKKYFIALLVLIFGLFGYSKYFVVERNFGGGDAPEEIKSEVLTQPNKFEELTIPYLRSRSYFGELGEKKLYEEKNQYNSYLTSYESDGLKINGLLTVPKGDTPSGGWPAVVFVHGYIPPTLYKTTEKYIEYVDYLAKNGLVVFKIDLRGHGESEGEPGGAYYSADYVIDVLNAYSALQKSLVVDSKRVGLWGHSMAGNVLFRAAVVKKDIPKVVIWAGAVYSYSDMEKYGIQDNSYRPVGMSVDRQKRRQELFETYGQFSDSSAFWKKVVGLNFLEGVTTKFSIHHAVDDSVVNIGYSRDLQKELMEKNINVEQFEYGTGGHNISGSSFGQAIKRSADFFKN